jgi:hypothetical protein
LVKGKIPSLSNSAPKKKVENEAQNSPIKLTANNSSGDSKKEKKKCC